MRVSLLKRVKASGDRGARSRKQMLLKIKSKAAAWKQDFQRSLLALHYDVFDKPKVPFLSAVCTIEVVDPPTAFAPALPILFNLPLSSTYYRA